HPPTRPSPLPHTPPHLHTPHPAQIPHMPHASQHPTGGAAVTPSGPSPSGSEPAAHHRHPARPEAHLAPPAPIQTVSPLSPTPHGAAGASVAAQLSSLYANVAGPPPFLIPIYKQAGRRYHVPWEVLAAINSIETNYGRDLSV